MLKILNWNVNSIRKRKEQLAYILKQEEIDIALIQETKCLEDQFPYEEFDSIGYHSYVKGEKARNGVAIITKYKLNDVKYELYSEDISARYIEGTINYNDNQMIISSVYVPNGQGIDFPAFQYKLKFFDQLYNYMSELLKKEKMTIIGGDYNVAPDGIDVYSPEILEGSICFNILERKKIRSILNLGYSDAFRTLNRYKQKFSWWNYLNRGWESNKGMRIDHMLLSPQAIDNLKFCDTLTNVRGLESPSDHAPVLSILS